MITLKLKTKKDDDSTCQLYRFPDDIPYGFSIRSSPIFGKTLAINAIPSMVCPGRCIYCQFGRTAHQTVDRERFFSIDRTLPSLENAVAVNPDIDYIEICGNGEVALNSDLHWLISNIRKITNKPVAIDSCGSLCWRASVYNDFLKCDAVSVHIDAPNRTVYHTINQFQQQIPFDRYISGLKNLRNSFRGDFFIKVCIIDGINTDESVFYKLVSTVKSFSPAAVFVSSQSIMLDNKFIAALSGERLYEKTTHFGSIAQCADTVSKQVS